MVPLQRLVDEVHRAEAALRALRDISRVLPGTPEPKSEAAYIARIARKALLADKQGQIERGQLKKTTVQKKTAAKKPDGGVLSYWVSLLLR